MLPEDVQGLGIICDVGGVLEGNRFPDPVPLPTARALISGSGCCGGYHSAGTGILA